ANGWVYQDRLGSIGKFYPFGLERSGTANGTEKFTGYFRDAETGLDYADQRYEQPGMGRFLTTDPSSGSGQAFDPGTWNLYAYVGGDPISRTDPTGQDYCDGSGYCYDVYGNPYPDPSYGYYGYSYSDPYDYGYSDPYGYGYDSYSDPSYGTEYPDVGAAPNCGSAARPCPTTPVPVFRVVCSISLVTAFIPGIPTPFRVPALICGLVKMWM
ncbi:MAG: RHS repeat-associated core domain-containing protein, partial [Bryobacterales bacterium]|nr:RHS repeat-associated core domain-containing protein [Bryobacterales bacterium]